MEITVNGKPQTQPDQITIEQLLDCAGFAGQIECVEELDW